MPAMGREFIQLRPGWTIAQSHGETIWSVIRFVDGQDNPIPHLKWGKSYAILRNVATGSIRKIAGTTLYALYRIVDRVTDPNIPADPPIVRTVHREGQ